MNENDLIELVAVLAGIGRGAKLKYEKVSIG